MRDIRPDEAWKFTNACAAEFGSSTAAANGAGLDHRR